LLILEDQGYRIGRPFDLLLKEFMDTQVSWVILRRIIETKEQFGSLLLGKNL